MRLQGREELGNIRFVYIVLFDANECKSNFEMTHVRLHTTGGDDYLGNNSVEYAKIRPHTLGERPQIRQELPVRSEDTLRIGLGVLLDPLRCHTGRDPDRRFLRPKSLSQIIRAIMLGMKACLLYTSPSPRDS